MKRSQQDALLNDGNSDFGKKSSISHFSQAGERPNTLAVAAAWLR